MQQFNSKARPGRCVALVAGLATGLAAVSAAHADQRPATPPEMMLAPVAGGLQIFEVDQPAALRSRAVRAETSRRGKAAGLARRELDLTAKIAVKTNDLESLRTRVGPGIEVSASTVTGYAIVEAANVRDSATLAGKLWASGAFPSVEMVTQAPRALRTPVGDLLDSQWHLRNFDVTEADVNATAAWDLGYSGLGVIIGIVEGGFQEEHPDLAANVVPEASISTVNQTRHATSVAGIAAARGDTAEGGTGLAYNAGLALQYYGNTSLSTSIALNHAKDLTDIKSNSWGPPDLRRLEPIPAIELDAIVDAATTGRGGLGTIFTWAAGNGGEQDRVDYDSWASSRFTIAVGAIGFDDKEPSYNELGSSMLVVAHSEGGGQQITTTDLIGSSGYSPGDYTNNFGGTSAACPLAAGAIALALEANPGLTRRDVTHLLVETARQCDPTDSTWGSNGAGRLVSEKFGFGAVDAGALVLAAETWTNVGPEESVTSGVVPVSTLIPDNNPTGVTRTVDLPAGITIEAVEFVLNAQSTFIGDIEILLTSPAGTVSPLARRRADSTGDVTDFVFTSFRHFGEDSGGTWTIQLADLAGQDTTVWDDFELRAFGTSALCLADVNNDGVADNGDIGAFVDLFLAADLTADVNGDGIVDNGDIGTFVALFLAGC